MKSVANNKNTVGSERGNTSRLLSTSREHEELTIDNIKDACQKHYRSMIGKGMTCDVLAGERGPFYAARFLK